MKWSKEALSVAEQPGIETNAKSSSTLIAFDLTEREHEVLRLLISGQSDRDMGDVLFISHRTVQKHVANIFVKLGVNSRVAAVTIAMRAGLVSTEP